ncbi:RsmB/NOP family class I SAM-dependent RNA methyltransferase [Erythrobacter sp. F6033]|uniref:RsmB/NOP family class I SAM-dependent RNA methyltransferase n=1 Tax=Erythrobacter sp. F6033 TaxID=2926401 RepID=UPI001FF63404|nr:RsmB/NOP family class I SAM-dependent RNA methyltransferase [Erythrobacter sp. F6033]MCK0128205.1 RsmB/NOP family class I SAM-dependent RNA methyltransferase [Erythrobacter sp. F6033]
MMPAARVQAAIELLDAIIDGAKREGAPADRLISAYFKQRRYAGSKDRRAVRELVYRAIRHCGEIPRTGRAAMLALAQDDAQLVPLFDGSTHGPPAIGGKEQPADAGIAPEWLIKSLAASGIEGEAAQAMLGRAPLDVRVNTLKADRETLELPEAFEKLEAPNALRLAAGTNVDQWPVYREGKIEVQDHGSQIACLAADARSGETVIDLCAGAGGKTLSLAAAMGNMGELIAADTDRGRLSKLKPRAERAGAGMVQTVLLDPKSELEALEGFVGKADLVLVDAPCSGTGTWRRKPEAKWRLTQASLEGYARLQDELLEIAAKLVKPGGRIAFVTCSLLDTEGKDRVAEFLERNEGFTAETPELPLGVPHGDGVRLDPFQHGTDGFFVAIMRCA